MTTHDQHDIIRSVENGEWQSVENFEDVKKSLIQAASKTALKNYRINVRISRNPGK
ncbi:hypothetical protein U27_00770 [Candidatus Vecturithrix granuli]|uniref:Uncharacterized protein n=1 Tax=Vecturithrix granuli TaxID=1499967 RepID=A0A081C8G7_VECG1|nr:hypothetical protein U27_00770 [Candidatus Vecturithrix granuli]